MIPALAIKRDAYQRGLRAGRRSKLYDEQSLRKAMDRFQNANPHHVFLLTEWLDGWRDAAIYRGDR
jgi:hypothetical protein